MQSVHDLLPSPEETFYLDSHYPFFQANCMSSIYEIKYSKTGVGYGGLDMAQGSEDIHNAKDWAAVKEAKLSFQNLDMY